MGNCKRLSIVYQLSGSSRIKFIQHSGLGENDGQGSNAQDVSYIGRDHGLRADISTATNSYQNVSFIHRFLFAKTIARPIRPVFCRSRQETDKLGVH